MKPENLFPILTGFVLATSLYYLVLPVELKAPCNLSTFVTISVFLFPGLYIIDTNEDLFEHFCARLNPLKGK